MPDEKKSRKTPVTARITSKSKRKSKPKPPIKISKEISSLIDPAMTVLLARSIRYGNAAVNWRCTDGVWTEGVLKADGSYGDYHVVPESEVPAEIRSLGCKK